MNRLKFHAPEKALAIVTCTSKLTLSWEPSFDSRVFQNLYFLLKIGFISVFSVFLYLFT